MPTLKPRAKRVIDEIELARLIDASGHIDAAFVERVAVRPGEGPSGALTAGYGFGLLVGILRAHFIPVTLVTPQKWKRGVGLPPGSTKDASREMAKARWQRQADFFTLKKHEGRAEAALIGAWGFTHDG
jgi:crossover junction endodeoxyribonuclease RuvC